MAKVYQTFYDIARFTLWADSPSEDGKRARFVLSFRDGNPRFVVYTGTPGKEGAINYPMDNMTMTTVMTKLIGIAKGQNENQISIESLTTVYENDKPTKQKKVTSTLVMGKNKDGIVYISVVADAKPKVVFPFKSSEFHVFRNNNKEVMSTADVSKDMAIGVAKLALQAIAIVMVNYTNEEYDDGARKPTLISSNGKAGSVKSPPVQFADLDDIL